jgi:hypothetical protein
LIHTDKTNEALRALGYDSDSASMELEFYKANGAISNNRTDAENEFLTAQGFTTGSVTDKWYALLSSLGYTGALPDMVDASNGIYQAVGGGGGPTDPEFANVALLLHMDGANGSTTFTDSSGTPKTVTAVSPAAISTTQFKFGGASGLFDGTNGELTTNILGSAFGTSDFCVEGWMWPNSAGNGNFRGIIGNGTGFGRFSLHLDGNTPPRLRVFSDGVLSSNSTTAVSTNTWSHFAFTRSGNTYRIFLNGVSVWSATESGLNLNTSDPIRIGFNSPGARWRGHLDEIRVTIGVARYTANFTPPTEAFPDA